MMAIIKHGGRIYRIPTGPYENNETVHERAWWIALQSPQLTKELPRLLSEASIRSNEKWLGMKYAR